MRKGLATQPSDPFAPGLCLQNAIEALDYGSSVKGGHNAL
jgi:hypothetical protein